MRSSSSAAWWDGWRRVRQAPVVAAGVFALTLALSAPLAFVMREGIRAHLGSSTRAERAADGVDYDWWHEFMAQASGLGTTFVPTILGFAATLDNLSSVADARRDPAPIAAALAVYLAAWTFVLGGIIDRYARERPIRAHGFFAASGVFFFRFLRLATVSGVVYWWLFAHVHPWLDDQYERLTRDVSAERVALAWRLGMYVVFGALVAAANILFDYAKIRLVVEDRRSAIGGLAAALRFITRHAGAVIGLYLLNTATFAALLAIWAAAAPGPTSAGPSMWIAFAGAQLYILARLGLKLHFLASQTALFQARLAHAGYVAAPRPVWPESPAAEAVSCPAEAGG